MTQIYRNYYGSGGKHRKQETSWRAMVEAYVGGYYGRGGDGHGRGHTEEVVVVVVRRRRWWLVSSLLFCLRTRH